MKKLTLFIIAIILLSNITYPSSFDGNYENAMRLISLGKRIHAQTFIQRCLINASNSINYIKLAKLYHRLNKRNPKIYNYLLKAFHLSKKTTSAVQIAKSYINLINNKHMADLSLKKGLHHSNSIKNCFIIARAAKQLTHTRYIMVSALHKARVFARTIEDWIRISDVYYNEFSDSEGASYALSQCWKVAQNRDDWAALGDAYRRIGYNSKALRAYNRANYSNW